MRVLPPTRGDEPRRLRADHGASVGRLLTAEGRVEREVEHAEMPITHLIVGRLTDRSDLLHALTDADADSAGSNWTEKALG